MNIEEKKQYIKELAEILDNNQSLYLTDISGLNAEDTQELRKQCFNKKIVLRVVKNTLLGKAMEGSQKDFNEIPNHLSGNTALMISEVSNLPAKLIKEFRKSHDKPLLKSAYAEESIYVGEDKLETLVHLKSKNEVIADLVYLLQSPIQKVLGQLQSGKDTISGIVKTLENRK